MLAKYEFSVNGITKVQAEWLLDLVIHHAEVMGGKFGGGVDVVEEEPEDELGEWIVDSDTEIKEEPQVGLKLELEGYDGQAKTTP